MKQIPGLQYVWSICALSLHCTAVWLGRLAVFLSRPGPKLRSGFACVIKQHLLGAAWRLHVLAKMAHATVTAEITKLDLTFNAVVFFSAEYSLNHRV